MRLPPLLCSFRPAGIRILTFVVPTVALLLVVPVRAQSENGSPAPFSVDDILDTARVRAAAVSEDGRWIAVTVSNMRDRIGIDNTRYGDPTYVRPTGAEVRIIDATTGDSERLLQHRAHVRRLAWSRDGERLAYLLQREDEIELRIRHRESGRESTVAPPEGHVFADNSGVDWLPDGTGILVACRKSSWVREARESFLRLTKGPVIVHSSEDPFLDWEALRRMSLRRSLWQWSEESGEFRNLIEDGNLRSYAVSRDGAFVRFEEDKTEKTSYDVIFGSDNRVRVLPLDGGEVRTVIESTKKVRARWSGDGRRYAFAEKGDLFFGSVDGGERRRLTGEAPSSEEEKNTETKPEAKAGSKTDAKPKKERFSVVSLSESGGRLIASSDKGMYWIDTKSGERTLFLPRPEDKKAAAKAPRHSVVAWSADERFLYLSYGARTHWERGFVRFDFDMREMEDLVKDERLYSGLVLARSGERVVFQRSEGNQPADIYTAGPLMHEPRRLTDVNPFVRQRATSKTELVDYLDVDGKTLHGVLYYPTPYKEGNRYPTIFLVYEQFFDNSFNGTINYLTSRGYAVMRPSVSLETGFPGEAWLKGVTAAANKLIERGIADADRLGVHGTSYGGYATNLLITQTKRFKAAINISGKVNMISFYTDSPRLGVRNIHAPEKSQDRIGATLWQQPQKYLAHSAILYADRITTPLLLITGDEDHNVPGRQAMEMYYALRRLGKKVEWVRYVNGGHGTPTSTVAEVFDYHRRILGWYDKLLKASAKPEAAVTGASGIGGREARAPGANR